MKSIAPIRFVITTMSSPTQQIVPFPSGSQLPASDAELEASLTPVLVYVDDTDLRRWYGAAKISTRACDNQREQFNGWIVEALNLYAGARSSAG